MMSFEQYLDLIIEACMAIFCAMAAIYAATGKQKDDTATKWMVAILIAGMVYNSAQTISYFYEGDMTRAGYLMVRASTFVEYTSFFVLVFFETGYLWRRIEIRGGRPGRRLRHFSVLFCATGIMLVIVSRFSHFYYSFDPHNHYIRTDLYGLHLLMAFLAIIPILLQTIRNRKILLRKEYHAFILLGLLPTFSTILEVLIPWDISFYGIAVSVTIFIIFTLFRRETAYLTTIRESMKLGPEEIETVSRDLDEFMTALGMEMSSRYKILLTIEEALLRMQEHFGKDEVFDVFAVIYFGRPQIRIEKKGELFNPLRKEADMQLELGGKILTSMGYNMLFNYTGERNILKLSLERQQMNPAIKMMIALMIGLIAGYMAINNLSEANQDILCDKLLLPVYEMMRNLLYCVTGPILFLMVITVILDTAGISEQGGDSKYIAGRYFLLSILMGVASLITVPFFLRDNLTEGMMSNNDPETLVNGFLSVIPKDIFTPFVEANTPQLILMAFVAGLAIVSLGRRGRDLHSVIRQMNLAGMHVARWIGGVMPYFTAVIAAVICINGHIKDLVLLVPTLIISLFITLVFMSIALLHAGIKWDVSPRKLMRKCRPSFMMALRTGSLDASFDMSEVCCTSKLGIDRRFTEDGLPFGMVMFMPANVIGTLLFIMYAVMRSGATISPLWLLLSVMLSVVLFAATPPIAGANFLAYIVMLSSLGLDMKFLMLALIYEIVYGVFASAANQFFVQMELTGQAGKIGLVRDDVIRSD